MFSPASRGPGESRAQRVIVEMPAAPDIPYPEGNKLGCHVFRATGITAYLEAGGTLETAQAMAAHESPRTTKLYDRTGDEITLDEVERITI
jgi:integrase